MDNDQEQKDIISDIEHQRREDEYENELAKGE